MNYEKIKWCIDKHKETNHLYDGYIPYEFHLRMTHAVYNKFKHVLDDNSDYFNRSTIPLDDNFVSLRDACHMACWSHDLIEDARVSYNDIKLKLGQEVADITFAVTNNTGRNRAERADDKYYEKIRNTRGAVFVKLCDRIANVEYGKLMGGYMFSVYKKENPEFLSKLGWGGNSPYFDAEVCMTYAPMFQYLTNLFED
jgi:(p)ppGpp synthase/HD superfamily hydrolase